MLEKTRLLVSSRALRFVIEHRDRIADGFRHQNRNGVSIQIGPNGHEFVGPYGAIGNSGKRYFFVPLSDGADDEGHVEVCDATLDGIGGVGQIGNATGGWVRFKGKNGGILAKFIDRHLQHVGTVESLDSLRQH